MKLKNKRILVYGLGDSGRAVLNVLKNKRDHVSFYDDDLRYWEYIGFERNPQEKFYDLVIVSPGIKCQGNKLLEIFRQKNMQIISEIDFAYLLSKGAIIAITGTNGKTTVSMLTHKILKSAGFKTFLCGNIGLPFSAVCEKATKDSITVCEVSNFQLETSQFFSPDVACILNIKPDHLDRHGSFEEYVKVKSKLCQNMKSQAKLILNFDDEEAKKLILHKKYQFFSKKTLKKGVFVKNNQIFVNKKNILSLNEIRLKGEKNLENVLASVAICSHFHLPAQSYSYAVSNFVPASHRMQMVGELDGVIFIDDSKATNVASTVACVEAYRNDVIILLMGGQGKDIEYDEIFRLKIPYKKIVCFGQEGKNIFECARRHALDAQAFEKFDDAVLFSKQIASKGDIVLLSPSCASFDEFSSYAERGERFKELVLQASQQLQGGDLL